MEDAYQQAIDNGGYLAVFETIEENNLSFINYPKRSNFLWFGLYQDTNDSNFAEPGVVGSGLKLQLPRIVKVSKD